MSPFKEPQPRKNSVEKDGEKVIGGAWPPYSRLGSEARWDPAKETGKLPEANIDGDTRTGYIPGVSEGRWEDEAPVPSEDARKRVREWAEARADLEIRKAALEAACALYAGQTDFGSFWPNIEVFEAYLRDGTKPS